MSAGNARALLELLSIEHPIVQAPMAGVSTAAMAASVSNGGALGSIGVGNLGAEKARAMIAAFRARSRRPLNVNVFCHAPARADRAREEAWIARFTPEFARLGARAPTALSEIYRSFVVDDAMLAALIADRPPVVSFHFGIPEEARVRALREAGILLLGSATNLEEAQHLVAGGVQAVVAQGYEAGGHRGCFDPDAPDERLSTLALTERLVRALPVPVIAAGGIMSGAGIAAALRIGACAAQLGTAFIGCAESQADASYRAALTTDAAHPTVMTRVLSGRPARCLENRFTALGAGVAPREVPDYPRAYDLAKALNAAAGVAKEPGFGAQWAGQGAKLARSLPAAELLAALISELAAR